MDVLDLFQRYRDDVYRLALNYTRSPQETCAAPDFGGGLFCPGPGGRDGCPDTASRRVSGALGDGRDRGSSALFPDGGRSGAASENVLLYARLAGI